MRKVDRLLINESEMVIHATGLAYLDSHNMNSSLAMDSAIDRAMCEINGRFSEYSLHNQWRVVSISTCVIPGNSINRFVSPEYLATIVAVAKVPKPVFAKINKNKGI